MPTSFRHFAVLTGNYVYMCNMTHSEVHGQGRRERVNNHTAKS